MAMGKRFIIAGGGTGGHIFPAIAIAQMLKKISPDSSFLFVGAKGKVYRTQRGELSILVDELEMLSKSILQNSYGLSVSLSGVCCCVILKSALFGLK
jgi:UDP-N-acetylglucosamine--N-acetylmuramyl-(pentapeptide) pyrophosphoryl-undecaprenol N-acetylglucosamine transferase